MAYNFDKPITTFASAKTPAWHGLGTTSEGAMTSEEALIKGGLDFTVEKKQTFIQVQDNRPKEILEQLGMEGNYVTNSIVKPVPNSHAIIRLDNNEILGSCTDRYEIVQNIEAFKFFDNVVGEGKAIFQTVGSLGKGEVVFITAKLPEPLVLGDDDLIEDYLVLATSHDGSLAVTVFFTKIRIVCCNTLSMALNGAKNKISIKHTKTVKDRMNVSSLLLGYNYEYGHLMLDNLNRFKQMQIKDIDVDKMLYMLILNDEEYKEAMLFNGNLSQAANISAKKKNQIADIRKTIYKGVGQQQYVGTALWFFNGVSCYMQNVKEYKSDSDRFETLVTNNTLLDDTFKLIDHYMLHVKQ